MKIQLLGWESQGLRCPDLKIDFSINGRVPKVGLLQMPNGVGKTTTLTCLRAAVDGSATEWSEEKVRSLKDPNTSNNKGLFIARLLVNDKEPLTLEMNFDFENGCVTYKTTYKKRQEPGFVPPVEAAMFLNPRFAKLFIFDGELAKGLLDEGGEDASRVIDTFYQLYLLDQMKKVALDELEDHTKRRRSANPVVVDRLGREIERLTEQREQLVRDADEQRVKLQNALTRIETLESEVGEQIKRHEQYRDQEKDAEKALSKAEKDLELQLQKLASEIPDPCYVHPAFSLGLKQFAVSLERLKLPGPSSRIFFTELADEEDDCICGRPMTEECRAHVRDRAKDILADEASSFMNSLKSDIRQLGVYDEGRLKDRVDALSQIRRRFTEAESNKNRIRNELSGDAEIQQRQEELEGCKTSAETARKFLDSFERDPLETDTEDSGCLKWFERELADRQTKRAELTDTIEFSDRTKRLTQILDKARAEAHEELKKSTVRDANERIKKVLKHSPLQILDITGKIQLGSESGVAQAGASVGQTLAIGYVFLTTLLDGTAHHFPLVVDSPAGPMDTDVRRQVAPLVPELCQQFIAFVISTEREGFVDPLAAAAGKDDVKFLTAFRITGGTQDLIDSLPTEGVTKSSNGVLVEGHEFFSRFQLLETA